LEAERNPLSLGRLHTIRNSGLKAGGSLDESQFDLAGGTIALLGDDEFSLAFQLGLIRLVNFLTEDERHHVGVLLDGSGFAQVGQLGTVVAPPALRGGAELGQVNHPEPIPEATSHGIYARQPSQVPSE